MYFLIFADELTGIVHIEIAKNNKLSNELQAIRNATHNIELIQNDTMNEPKTNLRPDSNATDGTQIIVSKSAPRNDDDLPELLNEAKSTIIQLQDDVNSLKAQVEMLRKQNDDYVMEIKELKERNNEINEIDKSMQTSLVGAQEMIHKLHQETGRYGENTAPPIPLEPIIIVNDKNERRSSLRSQKAINDSAKVMFTMFDCHRMFTICSLQKHLYIFFFSGGRAAVKKTIPTPMTKALVQTILLLCTYANKICDYNNFFYRFNYYRTKEKRMKKSPFCSPSKRDG